MKQTRLETEVPWTEGTPQRDDFYLVAIELGPTTGYFDMCVWEAGTWLTDHPERIIAFVGFHELKQHLNFNWPKRLPESFVETNDLPVPKVSSDWEEV
jgi:hypothetical protein